MSILFLFGRTKLVRIGINLVRGLGQINGFNENSRVLLKIGSSEREIKHLQHQIGLA
jgi:hypothetical protein